MTTSDKILPALEQVQAHMYGIQEKLDDFNLDEIISADETGLFYGAVPLNQYVPGDANRGTGPPGDEKARITIMFWGMASGKMGPIYVVIKCTAKGCDLTSTRVLQNLMVAGEFDCTRALDGS